MNARLLAGVLVSFALPRVALAQGGGSCCHERTADRPEWEHVGASHFSATMAAVGTIVALADRTIVIEVDSGQRFKSQPDTETRFAADKKTALAGRRNLRLEDFTVGAPVKLTFVAETGKLLEMRLRHEGTRLH